MKGMKWTVHWRSVALGLGAGLLALLCACAGAAGLMAGGTVEVDTMGLWAAGITVGSALLGSLGAMATGGTAVEAALTALGELVVLFGLNGVLSGGEMEGIGVTVLALAGGCGAAILLRMGQGSGRRRRRRPRRKS